MSKIDNITLADGLASPATHVFSPVQPQQGTIPAAWKNSEQDVMAGDRKITLRVSEKASAYAVEARISDPVLTALPDNCCTPTNIPQVAYTEIASLSFSIAKSSTVQNRKDILAFAKNLLGTSVLTDAVVKLDSAW